MIDDHNSVDDRSDDILQGHAFWKMKKLLRCLLQYKCTDQST